MYKIGLKSIESHAFCVTVALQCAACCAFCVFGVWSMLYVTDSSFLLSSAHHSYRKRSEPVPVCMCVCVRLCVYC